MRFSNIKEYLIFIIGRAFEGCAETKKRDNSFKQFLKIKKMYGSPFDSRGYPMTVTTEIILDDIVLEKHIFDKALVAVGLHKNLNSAKTSTTRSLKDLENEGYILIKKKEGDQIHCSLTDKGVKRYFEISPKIKHLIGIIDYINFKKPGFLSLYPYYNLSNKEMIEHLERNINNPMKRNWKGTKGIFRRSIKDLKEAEKWDKKMKELGK